MLLAAGLLASACATSGPPRSAPLELHDQGGFLIREEVSVSARVRANFERAIGLLEAGEHEAGISLLVEVTEAAPDLTTAHIDLAIAYVRIDDLVRAETCLRRALELSPRHPAAHNELGILYRKLGRFDEARQSYETALAAYPQFHFARRNLAILCDVYLADLPCALEHYELYAQAVPQDEDVAIWIADLRTRAGRREIP